MTMNRMLKQIALSVGGALTLFAFADAANAQSAAEAFDSCKPQEWEAFAAAVDRNDMAMLQQMIDSPEMGTCDGLLATARVLVCAADPLQCIEPAAGLPVTEYFEMSPPPTVECPAWKPRCTDPLPPPGASIGIERDHNENGIGGGGGGGGGGPSYQSFGTSSHQNFGHAPQP